MGYVLDDQVVLITGAATGIGALVVRYLLQENVKHVAIVDIAQDAGIALQDELNEKHGENKVKFYNVDVTDDDKLFGVYNSVIDEHGYLDIVINNAGILNDSLRTYKKQIQVNVTALISSTLKALEVMRKDEGGRGGLVVNISSIAALARTAMTPIYSATKSAVLHFTNCIGLEDLSTRSGVRMVAVCFGATDTPLLSPKNMDTFDQGLQDLLFGEGLKQFYFQKPESAARGVVEVCKSGESGSTWVVAGDKPAQNINATMTQNFAALEQLGL